MPRPPSSIVKQQFFTEIGSKRDPANHKAVCNDAQCKATYLWTTSTGSLRKHIRTNHRDLYRQLELCESLTQQTSCSDTRGGGVAVTSSIDEATSLEAGPVGETDTTMVRPSPRSRKRHAEEVIDMTYTDADTAEQPQGLSCSRVMVNHRRRGVHLIHHIPDGEEGAGHAFHYWVHISATESTAIEAADIPAEPAT